MKTILIQPSYKNIFKIIISAFKDINLEKNLFRNSDSYNCDFNRMQFYSFK